jgi:hypothetical protein
VPLSYPVFLVVGLSVAVMLGAALAGPLSVLAIVGFWVAHWFFVEWSLNSAPLNTMSDAELQRVLQDWTKRGISYYSSSNLSRALTTGDRAKIDRAIARVIDIYDEAIRRYEKLGVNVEDYRAERERLRNGGFNA